MAAETFSTGKVILSVDLTRTEQPNTLLSMETDGRWAARKLLGGIVTSTACAQ